MKGSAGRLTSEGEEAGWPADEKKPRVSLGGGTWSFALWFTDDEGAISQPSEITVTVGEAPEMDGGS